MGTEQVVRLSSPFFSFKLKEIIMSRSLYRKTANVYLDVRVDFVSKKQLKRSLLSKPAVERKQSHVKE